MKTLNEDEKKTLKARCEAEWNTETKEEFRGNFQAYLAFQTASAEGRAKILKGVVHV